MKELSELHINFLISLFRKIEMRKLSQILGNKYKFLYPLLLPSYLLSTQIVVPDDYYISKDDNLSYIYSKEYREILPKIKEYQEDIISNYEREYGYKLDEKLYVGLASFKNQIANGFSTQIPFNSQILYGAGAGYIDYFCFSSWLKTLIIHETSHNFQVNPKENNLSKISHKILGNSSLGFVSILPLFPIPNITESPFILEGNAVMNESRYSNGGRLFSGYALAEVISSAKAGKITPELMYNSTLSFPYGEHFYIIGGFFQQFLLKRYGIDRVNSYFKTYATQPFPFFTNWVFKEQFGEDFETLLDKFVEDIKKEHKDFKSTNGEIISKSKIFVPLNADKNEIYTLVSDKKSAPKILKVDKRSNRVDYLDGSWRIGEIFKRGQAYYSQSSAKTSPTKITMGLFDRDGYLIEGTDGKVVQGYTSNNKMVYFDILSSLETPQVYIDGEFYSQSHSSVYVNRDDLYYFRQYGEKRILYKNREALFEYKGYYGFVVDISNEGTIYFIAPSKDGSSLYSLEGGVSRRVLYGDDIIDFKLLNRNEGVVATIGEDGYSYKLVSLAKAIETKPYQFKIKQYIKEKPKVYKKRERIKVEEYNSLGELKYSSLNQVMSYATDSGFGLDIKLNFIDPLMQNSLYIPISFNENRTIAGINYENVAYPIEFGGGVYGVYKSENIYSDLRDYGLDFYLKYPFLAKGYWRGSTELSYTRAYDNIYRKPLTLSLDISNNKKFGLSKYTNRANELSLFISRDRDSHIFGASYIFEHDMPWQSYLGVRGEYLKSDKVSPFLEKGIEVGYRLNNLQSDRGVVDIPTFKDIAYADEVKVGEISLKKVFDGSIYNFSFPISIQRESIYLKERFYKIDFNKKIAKNYNETVVGVESDLLFLHKIPIPMTIEYLYNSNIKDSEQIRFLFGIRY